MYLIVENLSNIIITMGLLLDIFGVWIIALDILKTYQGVMYESQRGVNDVLTRGFHKSIDGAPDEETPEYKEYIQKLTSMRKRGLYILSFGFLLQIVGVWV